MVGTVQKYGPGKVFFVSSDFVPYAVCPGIQTDSSDRLASLLKTFFLLQIFLINIIYKWQKIKQIYYKVIS